MTKLSFVIPWASNWQNQNPIPGWTPNHLSSSLLSYLSLPVWGTKGPRSPSHWHQQRRELRMAAGGNRSSREVALPRASHTGQWHPRIHLTAFFLKCFPDTYIWKWTQNQNGLTVPHPSQVNQTLTQWAKGPPPSFTIQMALGCILIICSKYFGV